jgi:YVTN family beta-propeller protein
MPPLRLTNLLQTALPDLSKPAQAVVCTLACLNGRPPAAREVAVWVGLRDRYHLRRVLRAEGLPPFEQLAGWARVLYWISEAEASGASLLQLARREQTTPAAAYRLVRRVTGTRWSEVRNAGLAVAVLRLRDARHQGIVGARPAATPQTPWTVEVRQTAMLGTPPHVSTPNPPRHPDGVLGERVAVGGAPFDVAITSTGLALLTRGHAATVDVLSLRPFSHLGSIQTGAAPTRVQVSHSGERAYVTNQFAQEVGILDLRTGLQIAAIPIAGHPLGAALAPDGRTLYVTTNTDRLQAVAIGSRRIVASTAIPWGSPQISMHPGGHRVYVAGWKAGVITECDTSTLRAVRTFRTGGITQDIVVTSNGSTLYAANQSGWVDVFALGNGRHVAKVEMGAPAFGLALSADESVLSVSLVFSGAVCMLEAHTFHVRSTVRPGGKPRLMARDPSGRTLLVANEAGWVDQIL